MKTLRHPNITKHTVFVLPDLARTVKVESDQSEHVAKVSDGTKNVRISFKNSNIYLKFRLKKISNHHKVRNLSKNK